MNAHDAICKAAHDALCKLRIPHADHVWTSPVPFFDYVADEIEAAVAAAGYTITLTDDGAAAPGGAPGNASAFGPSTGATPTAAPSSPTSEYSDLEYATRLDGTTMPAPKVLPNEFCWCGGEVGSRSPGDHLGLGCLADVKHNWNAASQEGQRVIELSAVLSVHQPYIDRYGNYTTCKCGATCKWSGDHQAAALLAVSEGATPAIDREALTGAIADELANWVDHPPTQRWGVARQVVDAILPLIEGAR